MGSILGAAKKFVEEIARMHTNTVPLVGIALSSIIIIVYYMIKYLVIHCKKNSIIHSPLSSFLYFIQNVSQYSSYFVVVVTVYVV